MDVVWIVLCGLAAGVFGGMGMGGGTLLIPLLGLIGINQYAVQAANLISFLPMSAVVLIIHFKNKLVETKGTPLIIVPAVAATIGGAILTHATNEKILKICFAGFVFVLGVWQFVVAVKAMKGKKEEKTLQTEERE